MIAADYDGDQTDNGSSDIAIDIRGTSSATTTITDYSDITHRNAYITGGGTIWSKRYIDAELGLKEAGVDISTKYLGINAKASDSELLDGLDSTAFLKTTDTIDADTLGGLTTSQLARTDTDETFNGDVIINGSLTMQSASFNVADSIFFEGQKHAITYNDSEGNFNIRVGHVSDSTPNEVCTEAGYTFHTEWSQSGGWWQQNISQNALVGELVNWEHTLQFDTVGLKVNGSKVLTEATPVVTPIIKLLSSGATAQDAQTTHEVLFETQSINTDTSVFNKPNNTDIKVLTNGIYKVTYNTRYSNGGTNRFSSYARVLKNGSAVNETYTKAYSRGTSYGSQLTNYCQTVLELNANDVLSIQIGKQQADQTTAVNKSATGCFFQVEKIG
jgi:hypothetical protein